MAALVNALSKEPVQATATTVVSSAASWAGRLVSLPGFSSGSLLTGALFGILTNRFANITEIALKKLSFFVETTKRGDGSTKKEKEPALNKYGRVASHLIGGAAATGVCIGLGLMTTANLIQAVALTALAFALSTIVPPAARMTTNVIKGINDKWTEFRKPAEPQPKDKPEDQPEDQLENKSL